MKSISNHDSSIKPFEPIQYQERSRTREDKSASSDTSVRIRLPACYQELASIVLMGWTLIPLYPDSKRPFGMSWESAAITQAHHLRLAFKRPGPRAGFAVWLGRSKIVTLDVDPKRDGDKSLQDLIAKYGPLPETPNDMRLGGGPHFYFQQPEGFADLKLASNIELADGLELKSGRSLCSIPPSRARQWVVSPLEMKLADPPKWMVKLAVDLGKRRTEAVPSPIPYRDRPAGFNISRQIKRARGLCRKHGPAIQSQNGHDHTIKLTYKLTHGFRVPLTLEEALMVLREWNEGNVPPHSDKDLERKLKESWDHPGPTGFLDPDPIPLVETGPEENLSAVLRSPAVKVEAPTVPAVQPDSTYEKPNVKIGKKDFSSLGVSLSLLIDTQNPRLKKSPLPKLTSGDFCAYFAAKCEPFFNDLLACSDPPWSLLLADNFDPTGRAEVEPTCRRTSCEPCLLREKQDFVRRVFEGLKPFRFIPLWGLLAPHTFWLSRIPSKQWANVSSRINYRNGRAATVNLPGNRAFVLSTVPLGKRIGMPRDKIKMNDRLRRWLKKQMPVSSVWQKSHTSIRERIEVDAALWRWLKRESPAPWVKVWTGRTTYEKAFAAIVKAVASVPVSPKPKYGDDERNRPFNASQGFLPKYPAKWDQLPHYPDSRNPLVPSRYMNIVKLNGVEADIAMIGGVMRNLKAWDGELRLSSIGATLDLPKGKSKQARLEVLEPAMERLAEHKAALLGKTYSRLALLDHLSYDRGEQNMLQARDGDLIAKGSVIDPAKLRPNKTNRLFAYNHHAKDELESPGTYGDRCWKIDRKITGQSCWDVPFQEDEPLPPGEAFDTRMEPSPMKGVG